MKRYLRSSLMITCMLLSIAAFSLTSSSLVTATSTGFCADCSLQCANEAYYIMDECYIHGGSAEQCTVEHRDYYNSCVTLFCNSMGCTLRKLPRTGPIGN